MTDLLRTLQGETTDVEFAVQIGVPRSTYTMVKLGRRYANEKLVAGLLRNFADHSEEIVAAFGQLPPFSERPSGRRGRAAPSSESEFQQSLIEMIRTGRGPEARAGINRALGTSADAPHKLWLLDHLADLEFGSGRFDEGIDAWESALAVAVAADLYEDEIELRSRIASRLTNGGFPDQALHVIDDGLVRDPEAGRLWRRKGIIQWHQHDYSNAYASLVSAASNGVSTELVLYARGQVLAEWGAHASAVAELSKALRQKLPAERAAYVRVTRAHAYAQLGKTKLALREFATAERVTPENGWLHYFRALCHATLGDKEAAVEGLVRAVRSEVPPLNPKKREHALALLADMGVRLDS